MAKTISCALCGSHALDVPENRLPHGVTSYACLYRVEVCDYPSGGYAPEGMLEWCERRRAEIEGRTVEQSRPRQMEMFA